MRTYFHSAGCPSAPTRVLCLVGNECISQLWPNPSALTQRSRPGRPAVISRAPLPRTAIFGCEESMSLGRGFTGDHVWPLSVLVEERKGSVLCDGTPSPPSTRMAAKRVRLSFTSRNWILVGANVSVLSFGGSDSVGQTSVWRDTTRPRKRDVSSMTPPGPARPWPAMHLYRHSTIPYHTTAQHV